MKRPHVPRKLTALRAKQEALKQEIRQNIGDLITQWIGKSTKIGLTLGLTTVVYLMVYSLLRRKGKKKEQLHPKDKPHAVPSEKGPTKKWIYTLLKGVIAHLISKGKYPQLKALLPYLSKGKAGWVGSILLAMLPWVLRVLVGAFSRPRSRTSS